MFKLLSGNSLIASFPFHMVILHSYLSLPKGKVSMEQTKVLRFYMFHHVSMLRMIFAKLQEKEALNCNCSKLFYHVLSMSDHTMAIKPNRSGYTLPHIWCNWV